MKDRYITDIISKMSIDQKVGALLTLGFSGTIARPHLYDYIEKFHCGGLRLTPFSRLFGSYVDPRTNKDVGNYEDNKGFRKGVEAPHGDVISYAAVLDELQAAALSRPLSIPLHFSFDQEGGTSADFNFGGVNIFPKPMGIKAAGDINLAYDIARAVSRQSKAVGFSWIHSPVLDVNVEPNNPEIYTRAYSDKAEEVAEYAVKTCEGFKDGGMIATGKHFPGRGDSKLDAHFNVPVIDVDRDTMLKRELLPYRALIERGLLPSVMIAHSIFPAFDENDIATCSKKVIMGLLRDELGFNGVITTDSMTMGGVAIRYGVSNACAISLECGADLVLMKAENHLVEDTFNTIKRFVSEGRIPEAELDEKVYRVLSVKYEYGLFMPRKRENPEEVIRDKEIIKLSKRVAARSVTVQNSKDLPLSKTDKVLLIEQINKVPNDMFWHPGILLKNCLKYNGMVDYLETEYTYDELDKENIMREIVKYGTVILTNFYMRGKLSNNVFIEELLKDKTKRFVVVTNTPYPLSIPNGCDNLVITYATSPDNMEVTAGILFGDKEEQNEDRKRKMD